ncbi:Tad domain-containing protein [Jannaschia formosa]|uniref:Tad domain-containing protein n=1 Tax=Jannaschia formosa TaxID=2259592 RepID=UPI000E1BBD4A|nr:Tad domain-containing protein [Jannaschia formosa]
MLLRSTRIPAPALRSPRDYMRDEDGALTVVGLIFFAVMVLAGGVAWDMMRSERDRAELQYATDRATLAAASLSQTRDPKQVVEDYLEAAGIRHDSVRIQTFKDDVSSRVTVHGRSETPSMFMNMVGQDEMRAPVWSQAREEKWDLEVSVVLDISGSMNSAGRHPAMQEAAVEFTQKILQRAEDEGALSTISIVPYRDTVNLGSKMGPWFNLSMEHTRSFCASFPNPSIAYKQTGIDAGTVLTRVMHFDRFEYNRNFDGDIRRPTCPTDDFAAILPWSSDIDEIETHINDLQAAAGTAINLGVKWGLALLDPSLRVHADRLIANGDLSEDFEGLPFDYGQSQKRKILVVMTDGQNDEQRDIYPDRRNGPSGVFVYRPDLEVPVQAAQPIEIPKLPEVSCLETGFINTQTLDCVTEAALELPSYGLDNIDGTLSRWSPSWFATRGAAQDWAANGGRYTGYPWWEDADRRNWTDFEGTGTHPVTGETVATQYSVWSEERGMFWVKRVRNNRNQSSGGEWRNEPAGGSQAIELSFAEFYSAVPVTFNNFWRGQGRYPGIDDATRDFYQRYVGENSMTDELNVYLSDACKAARNAGIIVFTIAFQAPDKGRRAMQDCAGDPKRYFNVVDLDIDRAFDDIFASINLLRLTQ